MSEQKDSVRYISHAEQMRISLTKPEARKIQYLKSYNGTNISQLVRLAIHKEYADKLEVMKRAAPPGVEFPDPNDY